MQTLSSVVFALLSVVFSVAAFAEAGKHKLYQIRLAPAASAEKSTRVSAPYCNAIYAGDFQKNGETLAAFATAPGCGSLSMSGPAYEFREMRIVGGLKYLITTKNPERMGEVPAASGSVQLGDEVMVMNDRGAQFSIGSTSYTITPLSSDDNPFPLVLMSANVGAVGMANITQNVCTSTGCVETNASQLYGLFILDRVVPVYPGTAVLTLEGKLAGMVLGYDNGVTVVVNAWNMANALCEMGDVPQNCKG